MLTIGSRLDILKIRDKFSFCWISKKDNFNKNKKILKVK